MAKRIAPTDEARAHEGAAFPRKQAPAVAWRGGLAGPYATLALAARRLGRSWRLLLAVELGMIIAVALLAAAPFYGDLVASAQLQSTLASAAGPDRNLQVDATVATLYHPNLTAIDQTVEGVVRSYVGGIVTGPTEYLQTTRPLALTQLNGKPIASALPLYPAYKGAEDLAMAFDYTQAAPYMKLYAGRLPREVSGNGLPEVMVTPAMGVRPGAILTFADSQVASLTYHARVVGVWFPKNESDPFWNGLGFDTVVSTILNNPPPPQFPILFTRNALTQMFNYPPTPVHLPMGVGLHYIYYVNPIAITVGNAPSIADNLKTLRNALDADVPNVDSVVQVDLATSLNSLLGGVTNLLANQTLPLYSVDGQLVALALLFIFVMAGLLVESQAGEIATLKSRGASTTQILLTYLTQGLLLGLGALLVGMALAAGLALALVRFFVPLAPAIRVALTPAYLAHAINLRDALTPAVIGAGLGLLALLVASGQAARLDALAYRRGQGRDDRAPFWRRYYLDLGLVVLCGAAYLELATFGGLGTRVQLNSLAGTPGTTARAVDYVQAAAPTLLLLAGALLVQRALPLALRGLGWLAGRLRGATATLALAQAARATATFSRLTLLLTLAVGLGLYALSFQTTLRASAHDNAYYLTGADERVIIQPQSAGTQLTTGYAAAFAKLPGVQSVTPLYRGVALTLDNQGGANVDMLGVDPASFARTATWRGDYARQSLPRLMSILARAKHGPDAGTSAQPIVALIDQSYATTFQLSVGQAFQLSPQEAGQANTASSVRFVVGGVVNAFPTLYDEYAGGCVVVDVTDYLAALGNPNLAAYAENGPNEFLLRTRADPQAARARAKALTDPNFFVDSTLDARALTARYRADPLQAGMSGLLLLGALLAALLALVGTLTQAGVAARARRTQVAILRTLGLGAGQLVAALTLEQGLIYLLGTLGGVAIGALLAWGSLPFLGFTTASYTPPVIGVPSNQLAVNMSASLLYLGGLLGVFALALVVAALVARAAGLGRALRVGED